jgi:hypothetical protein
MAYGKDNNPPVCSFCGTPANGNVISAPNGVCICQTCLDTCCEMIYGSKNSGKGKNKKK